jgi:hypothetical protein
MHIPQAYGGLSNGTFPFGLGGCRGNDHSALGRGRQHGHDLYRANGGAAGTLRFSCGTP